MAKLRNVLQWNALLQMICQFISESVVIRNND